MIISTIKLILMTTGACVWIIIAAIAIGFTSARISNKIYQRKKRIEADKLARGRVDRWVSKGLK